MPIGEFCNREVVVTRRDAGIADAARLMREHHVGDLVVVDESAGAPVPVGIVTDRDLVVEVLAAAVDPGSLTVGDVMNERLLTGNDRDGVWDSLQRMRTQGVRRMPIVDPAGHLVGMITVDDLLELLAGEFKDLVTLVNREQARERAARR